MKVIKRGRDEFMHQVYPGREGLVDFPPIINKTKRLVLVYFLYLVDTPFFAVFIRFIEDCFFNNKYSLCYFVSQVRLEPNNIWVKGTPLQVDQVTKLVVVS